MWGFGFVFQNLCQLLRLQQLSGPSACLGSFIAPPTLEGQVDKVSWGLVLQVLVVVPGLSLEGLQGSCLNTKNNNHNR